MTTNTSKTPRDRRFEPSLRPASQSLKGVVQDAIAHAQNVEKRVRRRREDDQRNFEAVVSAVVMNLIYGELSTSDCRVRLTMSKAELTPALRPAPFMTEAFPSTVKTLHQAGIVDLQIGSHGAFSGSQSTLGVGDWLRSRLDDIDLGYEHISRDPSLLGPSVLLKGHKVRGVRRTHPLPQTERVRQLVQEMESINCWIAAADLEWTGEPVDLSRRQLVRIFSNDSFEQGGRLWRGFWMGLSKSDREQYLRIGDEPVVSLDFAHMGVTLAYSLVGAQPPKGDLYSIPGTGGSRDGVKKLLNAVLCSGKMPDRFPAGTKVYFPAGRKFHSLLDAISAHHAALVPLFGSARALELQYLESQVMVRTLLALKTEGVVGLPIHDALLVGRSNALIAKGTLERIFREVTGVEGRVEGSERGLPSTPKGNLSVSPKKGA